jgi:type IV pilus assembly protein PilN
MLKINLLDWRAELRETRRRQFLAAIGMSLAATAAAIGLWWFAEVRAIDNQNARNAMLRTEIAAIDKQIKELEDLERTRSNLIARMKVIEELQQSRSLVVHYFDELVNTVPEGVYLTSLKKTGTKTILDGIAESNGRVSTYMKNIDASPWFNDPRLIVIKTADAGGRRQSTFSLEVIQVNPNKPEEPAAPAPSRSKGKRK